MTWDTLEPRLEEETQRGFSGTVLAARNGEIILHRGFGLASRDRDIPNTTNTLFAIGSTPIDFTHAAILKLVDLGKLRIAEPITSFFKTVPPDKQNITIDQLMTGRSGLRDFHGIPGVDEDLDLSWIDRDTAVRRILTGELRFEPGTEQAHSHSAWGLLAVIVELVSGQEYEAFLRVQYFKPTGMTRTGLYPHALKFDPDEVAVGYGHIRIRPVNSPVHWGRTSWLVMGSGGMVSTAADLFRWNQALRSGALLSPESTKQFRGGGIAAGDNDRGFLTLFNTDLDTIVIVCANSHEEPGDHTTQVSLAAVSVARNR